MPQMLRADVRFALPDEFNGSLADAFRALADWLDDDEAGLDDLPVGACFGGSHHAWLHNRDLGLRLTGTMGIFAETAWGAWQAVVMQLSKRAHADSSMPWGALR